MVKHVFQITVPSRLPQLLGVKAVEVVANEKLTLSLHASKEVSLGASVT